MIIFTVDKNRFELKEEEGTLLGSILYKDNSFSNAQVLLEETFTLNLISTGIWNTQLTSGKTIKIVSEIKVGTGGMMTLRQINKRKKYIFKKSTNWKLRFSLFNASADEMLSLIPTVNWQKESHDYVLQLNEEFEKECNSFLILQAVHCANCSLSMMNGDKVPALISI
jgi:hypothetical protein